MFSTHHTLGKLGWGLAVAAASIALSAPAALAQDSFITDAIAQSDGSPSYRFVTDTLAPGGAPSDVLPLDSFITDAIGQGGGSPSYRFFTDTLAPGGGLVAAAPAADGFAWGAAGIGATSAAGLVLVLLGATRLLHRRIAVA
jgi:hypothetical protein